MPEGGTSGLRFSSDATAGITRRKTAHGFSYRHPRRGAVKDRKLLERIRKLAIPPAYRNVWICPDPNGHLQATGIDSRGRKQYRYHPKFRVAEEERKFDRMADFGRALPGLRAQIDNDLALPGLPKDRVVAVVVELLEKSLVRVGNERYAKENRSFGLTTMRTRHLKLSASHIEFDFKGKSNIEHRIEVRDRRLARIIKKLQDLPGQELFRYTDPSGKLGTVSSSDVNEYLHRYAGGDFTAKDFRTWGGSVLSAIELGIQESPESSAAADRSIKAAMKRVSERLGNTPKICQKCYVHPAVIEAFREGRLQTFFQEVPESPEELLQEAECVLAKLLKSSALVKPK